MNAINAVIKMIQIKMLQIIMQLMKQFDDAIKIKQI